MNESQHLTTLYSKLSTDIDQLTEKLAALQVEGRQVKQQLAAEGHLDLGSMTETLDTFASIEANNRQIDTLNSRYDAAVIKRSHAQLLLPQAYFAKMTLDYGDGPEAFYLGKVGYADANANDLVYDWRAPVADAYYANRIGATRYRANGREIPVTVAGRMQFVIDHDQLIHAIDSQTAVGDPLLLAVLAEDRSGGLQEITATIQQEQNAIIREADAPVVMVSGVAGSGKTSVMMQRIAYQLFQHRNDWAADNILILTPNRAFGQYIKGVLPSLGEAEAMTVTYPRLVNQLAKRFGFGNIEVSDEHLATIDAHLALPLDAFVGLAGVQAWHKSDRKQSFLVRMQRVWRWLKAMDQMPEDLPGWLDFDVLAQSFGVPFSAFDRLYVLLCITNYHQDQVTALFVDEAQDYPDAMWRLISNVFAKSQITMVGDPSQQLSGQAVTIAEYFDNRRVKQMALTTSYRATGAITETFAQYAGSRWRDQIQAVQAQGLPVKQITTPKLAPIIADLNAHAGQSIAVITPDSAGAEVLAATIGDAKLLTADGHQTVSAGVNVLPLSVAKGLEFDFVIVWDWQADFYQDAVFGENRRYVAASRGTKQLVLVNLPKAE